MLYFISGGEIIFVFFIILMIFGADKIPEIARGMGKGIRQVRDATQEIKSEIKKGSKNKGIETDNIKDDISKVKEDINVTAGTQIVGALGNQVAGGGEAVQNPDTEMEVNETTAQAFIFDPGVKLSSIVDAMNAVGASAADLVSILESLREAGALRAELVII